MSMLELRGDTIAAVATPNAVGGISVVRISGPDALQTADRIFRTVSGRPLASYKGYTAAYGHILRAGKLSTTGLPPSLRPPTATLVRMSSKFPATAACWSPGTSSVPPSGKVRGLPAPANLPAAPF